MIFVFGSNVIYAKELTSTKIKINVPKNFRGFPKASSNIKLEWKKVKNADGYIIYKDNKKIKTINGNATVKYIDKNVSKGKKYKYRIVAYKKSENKKIKSDKSYQIKVKVTSEKSKTLNAGRVTSSSDECTIGIFESKKLKARAKVAKGVKKKSVLSKKIYWSSSDKTLATVDKNGKVYANKNKKTGVVKIYARAHNGVRKTFKVNIVNYSRPEKFDKNIVINKDLKPVTKKYLNELTDIALYFAHDKKGLNAKLELNESYDGVNIVPDIEIDKNIEDKIYTLLHEVGVDIEVSNGSLCVKYVDYFADGSVFTYSIYHCLTEKSVEDFFFNCKYSKIAERWYYQEEYLYN